MADSRGTRILLVLQCNHQMLGSAPASHFGVAAVAATLASPPPRESTSRDYAFLGGGGYCSRRFGERAVT